jgi:hypothetical protein
MDTCYIYIHIDPRTLEIRYVGKGSKKRAWDFIRRKAHHACWIKNLNKNHLKPIVEILMDNLLEDEAYLFERKCIKLYRDLGYSLTNIGEGGECGPRLPGKLNGFYGKKHDEKTRKLMSERQRESLKNNPERIRSGSKNPMFGKRGVLHPNYGKPLPDWQKKLISQIHLGKPSPTRKAIICLENNIEYPSILSAANDLKIRKTTIDKVLAGQLGHAGGYHFKYKNEETPEFMSRRIPPKRIQCIETGEIFDSAEMVAKKYNRSVSNLYMHLKGLKPLKYAGLTFKVYQEKDNDIT